MAGSGRAKNPGYVRIDLREKSVFDLMSGGNTTGVFQLESSGFKDLLRKLKPDCLEDVIVAVALYHRPGPLQSEWWTLSFGGNMVGKSSPIRTRTCRDPRRDLRGHGLPGAGHAGCKRPCGF